MLIPRVGTLISSSRSARIAIVLFLPKTLVSYRTFKLQRIVSLRSDVPLLSAFETASLYVERNKYLIVKASVFSICMKRVLISQCKPFLDLQNVSFSEKVFKFKSNVFKNNELLIEK